MIIAAAYSEDNEMLVIGGNDGIIEVWDPLTKQLKEDLPYQKND